MIKSKKEPLLDRLLAIKKELCNKLAHFDIVPDKVEFGDEKPKKAKLTLLIEKSNLRVTAVLNSEFEIDLSATCDPGKEILIFKPAKKISSKKIIKIYQYLLRRNKIPNLPPEEIVQKINHFLHLECDSWHASQEKTSLVQYLGLTEKEYAEWVRDPNSIYQIFKFEPIKGKE